MKTTLTASVLFLLLFSTSLNAADSSTQAEIEVLKRRIEELEAQQPNKQQDYQSSNKKKSTNSNFIRGPRGGCYTFSASGRKKYVDRSLCD